MSYACEIINSLDGGGGWIDDDAPFEIIQRVVFSYEILFVCLVHALLKIEVALNVKTPDTKFSTESFRKKIVN